MEKVDVNKQMEENTKDDIKKSSLDNAPATSTDTAVFKVPILAKKVPVKKEVESTLQPVEKESNVIADGEKTLFTKPSISPSEENNVLAEKRPPISFRPKNMVLPSEVYKPHRPSASEFLKHYSKAENTVDAQDNSKSNATDDKSKSHQTDTNVEPEVNKSRKEKSPSSKLKYDKPDWSCPCEEDSALAYSLEVLKTGSIIDKINLVKNEFFVFGRLSNCDVVLEHPSISRHHAILQFGKPGENDDVEFQKDGTAGFYLRDLGSTHGTFLNKARVPSDKYYRVKVGHMMKFGGSSRMYILQGPSEDEEQESEKTATELLEKTRAARKKKDLVKMMMGDDDSDEDDLDDKPSSSRKKQDENDTGITWGMLEEAVEESDDEEKNEEEDEEITFSLQDKKEPFYVKDPHKALKNFYEKEGLEVEFECTERRPGQWNVRLELPIDTPTGKAVVAEASLTGKKRDATNNCALEACRLLDKYGMFKQSEHHRRKVRQWEKEDFYDSDEDQYWDRTGDLEKKRRQRKLRVGVKNKSSNDKPETYESLRKQLDDLEKEISEIEKQLDSDKQATRTKQDSADPLEEFMRQVKSGKTLDSVTRSKMKLRLFEARKESARLVKLAEIARPAALPPLDSAGTKSMSFIGRMKGKKKGLLIPSAHPPARKFEPIATKQDNVIEDDDDDDVIAEENDVATPSSNSNEIQIPLPDSVTHNPAGEVASAKDDALSSRPEVAEREKSNDDSTTDVTSTPVETTKHDADVTATMKGDGAKSIDNTSKRKRTFGPTLPQDLKDRLLGLNEHKENNGAEASKKRKKKTNKKNEVPIPEPGQTCSNDPDYADWMPPENQTGDGTTSLNAKFGY